MKHNEETLKKIVHDNADKTPHDIARLYAEHIYNDIMSCLPEKDSGENVIMKNYNITNKNDSMVVYRELTWNECREEFINCLKEKGYERNKIIEL